MMRLTDTTMVVSAIFQLAGKDDPHKISPGQITGFLNQKFGLDFPLHHVSDIIRGLGIVTHTVGNYRYLIWDDVRMSQIKQVYLVNLDYVKPEAEGGN